MARKKLPSLRSLRNKADRVFSAWIRRRDAHGRCCTCGSPASHAGHYIKRQHLGTRYDPRNCHAQCVRCNTYLGGNMDEYAKFLIAEYGVDILLTLGIAKRSVFKPTREWYAEIIKRYAD